MNNHLVKCNCKYKKQNNFKELLLNLNSLEKKINLIKKNIQNYRNNINNVLTNLIAVNIFSLDILKKNINEFIFFQNSLLQEMKIIYNNELKNNELKNNDKSIINLIYNKTIDNFSIKNGSNISEYFDNNSLNLKEISELSFNNISILIIPSFIFNLDNNSLTLKMNTYDIHNKEYKETYFILSDKINIDLEDNNIDINIYVNKLTDFYNSIIESSEFNKLNDILYIELKKIKFAKRTLHLYNFI